MTLIKWTPLFEQEMDKFFDDWKAPVMKGFTPAIDVYETADAVVVETALAGVSPSHVEVAIENDILTIKGEVKRESEVDEKNYYRREIRTGSFFRSVALPTHVVGDKAEAKAEGGILKITVPKAPEAKPKMIKVTVGDSK